MGCSFYGFGQWICQKKNLNSIFDLVEVADSDQFF